MSFAFDNHIILNDKKRDNTFSRMVINTTFPFGAVEMDLLSSYIKQMQQHFADFSEETKGVNTTLVKALLADIQNFSVKKETYTPKQRHK